MAAKFFDRVAVGITSTGTGSSVNLAATALPGYRTPTAAGVVSGDQLSYVIKDGNAWETGTGSWNGTTFSRTTVTTTSAGNTSRINLSGNAVLYLTAAASNLNKFIVNDEVAPIKAYTLDGTIVSGGVISLATANVFFMVVTGNVTLSVTNATSGKFNEFVLQIVNGGSATVSWPASFKWPGGVAPTLTAAGTDIVTVCSSDGGTTWLANLAMKDVY